MDKKILVSISRQTGVNAIRVGKALAEMLGIPFYDNKSMAALYDETDDMEYFIRSGENMAADKKYERPLSFLKSNSLNARMYEIQKETTRKLAEEGSAVFVTRCADDILRDFEGFVSVFLTSDHASRIKNVADYYKLSDRQAESQIAKMDKSRRTYYSFFTGKTWGERKNYSICMDITGIAPEKAAEILKMYIESF